MMRPVRRHCTIGNAALMMKGVAYLGIATCGFLALDAGEYDVFKTSWMVVGAGIGVIIALPAAWVTLGIAQAVKELLYAWLLLTTCLAVVAAISCSLLVYETGFYDTTFIRGLSNVAVVQISMTGLLLFGPVHWMVGVTTIPVVPHMRSVLLPLILTTTTFAGLGLTMMISCGWVYLFDWTIGLDMYFSHETNADRLFARLRIGLLVFAISTAMQGVIELAVLRLRLSSAAAETSAVPAISQGLQKSRSAPVKNA